jgi:hypothetical protein
MKQQMALVLTSINSPNSVLNALAQGALEAGVPFFLIGDTKSPADFKLDGCQFLNVEDQIASGLSFA